MKQERNNEMDVLLRRLGRRDGATVPDAAGDHLDADELNAYAENAVPGAARARYTAHLAECTRCRDLVVQLSASAGVVIAAETATVSRPWAMKTFLASLFTPMVLRYAAPALGLILVAVIGFVVLRRDEPAPYVTQVTNNEQPSATVSPEVTSLPGDTAPKAPPAQRELLDRQKGGLHAESAPVGNAPPVVSVETEAAKDASAAQPTPEQQATSANEPPPPKATATLEESPRTTETEDKKKVAPQTPVTAAPAGERSLRMAQSEGRKTDNDYARAGSGNRRAETDKASPTEGAGVGNLQRDGFLSSEARSVAGRRFRKQGSIWIDTAYNSSTDTMTVTRGSERYRALIADEPEIKTIADQLDGEIIVVWKGRAYRIR